MKKFTKSSFDLDEILTSASELKYTSEIKKIFNKQFEDPSKEFVKFFAKQVYHGVLTSNLKKKFSGITKKALNQYIKEQVNSRIKKVLDAEQPEETNIKPEKTPTSKIITTEDEWEGFFVVKGILCDIVDLDS